MDTAIHTLPQLFAQLGLPDDGESIRQFVARHAPLPGEVELAAAPFWSPAQSTFLCSELAQDADWSELIDTLDTLLRRS